jgi:plastocyanin
MRSYLAVAAILTVLPVTSLGCGDPNRPTAPRDVVGDQLIAAAVQPHASASERLVTMMDACDPESFNTAVGPGTCVERQAGVKFPSFIDELTRTQKAGAWVFAPPVTTARAGQTLLAVNRGGEVHTFTRVASFGGGIVPVLNELSGNPDIAPECLNLDADDFVPAGGIYEEEVGEEGTQRFQCCIHPWMRTTLRAR